MHSSSPSPVFFENSSDKNSAGEGGKDEVKEGRREWGLKDSWVSKERMDRAIMNYLINAGYKEAAEKFAVEAGIKMDKCLQHLDHRIAIKRLILKGDILSAINYINHTYPELLENKKHLYFRLLQQQTIEMIKEKKLEEALDFAQKNLVEKVVEDINVLPDVEHTLTLLAFHDANTSPYGHLLLPLHRHKVAKDVNTAILVYCDEDDSTEIGQLVQMIIWSQDELEHGKHKYTKMVNIGEGTIEKST